MSDELTPIRIENLGNLALDPKGRLYWKERLIYTGGLRGWQKNLIGLFAFLATVATIANATASWINLLKAKPAPVVIQPCPLPSRTAAPQAKP